MLFLIRPRLDEFNVNFNVEKRGLFSMNKILVTSVIAAAGLAVSGFAFAAGAGAYRAPAPRVNANTWYVGAGVNHNALLSSGYAGNADGNITTATNAVQPTYRLDHKGVGFNVFVGQRLSRSFGHEFGYTYIGTQGYKASDMTTNQSYGKVDIKTPFDFYYNGYYYMPLSYGFEAFAKGGLNYARTTTYYNSWARAGGANATAATEFYNGFAFNGGLGMQYNYQQFGTRVAYNHYFAPSNWNNNFAATPDTIGLDILWNFA